MDISDLFYIFAKVKKGMQPPTDPLTTTVAHLTHYTMLHTLLTAAVNHFNKVNNCTLPTDEITSVAQYILNQGKTHYLALYLDTDPDLDSDERYLPILSHEELQHQLDNYIHNYTMLATITVAGITIDIFTY